MSAMIALFMKYKYALSDNRKWREKVSLDGVANEMGITTHCLSGRKMSATRMIVLLIKWKNALALPVN